MEPFIAHTGGKDPSTYDYHVHIGLPSALIPSLPDYRHAVVIDGDGWNVWGEPIGTDDNDDDTYHVIFPANEDMVDMVIDDIGFAFENLAVPMGGHAGQRGIKMVLTTAQDWSEVEFSLYSLNAADL